MAPIVNVPPIKSQGIKTKLVPWIRSVVPLGFDGTWIEPFMGTGAVAFNVAPSRAILCDTNPHLIGFYAGIASHPHNLAYWHNPDGDPKATQALTLRRVSFSCIIAL